MAEDFRIQVETDLDTSKAEQKLNALLKEKRQIKLDIDINNQNVKNISKNIEKGIKDTRIDTSAITKQLADSFNISDKSVLKNLNKQLNNMVSSLGKTWNGSKFDFGKATGFYSGLDSMAKTIATNSKLVKSATGYYDDFYNYFKNKKIYVSDDLKKALGGDTYKELLQNNIGKITKDAKKGISVDSLWGEMSNLFPEHFSQNITNQADQIIHVFDLVKKARQDMTQSMNFSDLSTNQKFDVTSSAYEQVVTMGKEVADKLKSNIQSATEASKTSIDLDVNVDKEKIASQIKEAIASAGNNAGEAIKLDLQINDEQLLSNLRSSISKIASGDEPVKVDIDVDVNGLQEKLNSACHDMEIPVDFKIDSEDIASRIKAAVDGITDIELDLKVNTDSVRQAVDENLKKIEPEVDESGLTQLQQALHNINTAGQQSQSVFSSLGSTFKEAFSAYSLANVMQDMLYKIADGAREAVGTVKELNDSITSLEMATGENYNTVKQMMSQYNEMGQELGSITTDIAEGADSWLRQGKSVQETNQLLKDSMVLSKVSDLSASDSTQYLTSAMNGYKVAAEDVMSIVDKVSQVDLYSATDAGGLMEAMSRVSTTANTAGVSMDKLLGYLATTGEVTQRSMSSIGESFKTIFARMSDIKAQNYELVDEDGTVELLSDVESSLKKVGIDLRKTVTEYNSYDDVLDNLADKWSSLNQVQQNELSKAFAGVRQQEVFRTLMENYDRVKKYTKLAEDSAGTAEKKFNDNYLSSLEAKTQSLKASLESLSSSLISDDMYAGVLDGTKAIVDFTEKTQILKGTLAGLGTAGGIFAFQKIGSWVGEAVKEFSNLGTAMDMLKSGSVDTSGFKDLLSLTQNLSKSQTELVLSSTALTDAQRVAILTGQGMSASEAEAAVSAMGLSTANAAATTSTLSLGTAFKGLWATLMANPLILVATGVTAAVSAYSAYQQSVQESVSSAKEAGQKFSENTSSLQDNIAKVQELRSQLASGTLSESEAYQAKSDLLSIQNQLSDSYGSQAQGIDLVNGKLDEQIAKMQSLAQEEAKKYLNEEKSGIDKAQSEMNKNRGYNLGTFSNWDIRSKDTKNTLEKVKDIADQIKGIDFGIDERGQGAIFKFTGKAENAEESINSFMDKIRDLKSEMQDNGQDTTFLDSILDQSSKSLKKNKDILDEYQDINKQALEAQMTSEGFGKNKPATVYDDYKNAVEKYNDALSSGDTSKIKEAKSAFDDVKNSVDGVVEKYPQFKSLFNEVGSSLDKTAVKANNFKNALTGQNNDKFDTGLVKQYNTQLQNSKKLMESMSDEQKKFGNVSNTERPVIFWSDDEIKKQSTALKSWGEDLESLKGSYSTVMGTSSEFDGVEIAFTPILKMPDGSGKVMSSNQMSTYINSLIQEACKDGNGWTNEELFDLDTKGLDIDGVHISNMIADIGDTAAETGEKMHSVQEPLYEWAESYAKIQDKAKEAGISTEKYIDKSNKLLDFADKVSELKELNDVDLKGISFDDKTTAKGEEALKSVVDKAIELGVVSDDSAESVAKVVDMLTEMGLTGTVSVDALSESFSKAQTSIQQTMSDLDSMKSILAESVTGSGISADNVKAFKEMFGDDASKALEQTANGYHINRKALEQLQEQQAQGTKTDYLSAIAEQQEALRKVNEQMAKAVFNGEDISGLQSQRQSIEDNISSLKDLAYQYQTATSAFQQWQDAMSGGEEGDMYDSIQGNLESAESLYEKGLTGTNKFREFVDLMSNKDLSNASNEDIVSAYEEAMPKIKRYFTEGQEGAQNFLSDIQNINKEWSHMNEDGSWEINFGAGNDQEIADALGIDVEAVQSIMRKLSDYGFDINLDEPVASLEELKSSAESAKEALDGMNDTSLDGINLDADSFSAVTDSIDKVKDYIQQVQDSDIEPEVKTEKLQNANAILEYLVEKQQELGSSDIEIGVNIDEVNSKITEAQSALDQFKNSDGVVDLSVEGAQQAADNLQSLLYQKEALQNSSVVLNVDASQVDGSVGNAISKLQEYQTAVNNLNAQTELQKAGVQIDTSDAQAKVQQLASQIQGIDAETKAKLGLDTSEFNAALSSVTNTKVDVKAGVNLDTSSLGTIQSMISAISPKMLVKAGVDKSQVDGYQPSDKNSKVKYKVDSSAVDAFKPANKNATVTYSVVVAGQVPGDKTRTLTYNIKTNGSVSPANGTAHSLGTAHAKGTTNVSSNGNWGLRKDEPRALVNELKPEIVVRDGEPFIVNGGDPAFTSLKKDDIVFNGEQSEALLKNGYVTGSHGKLAYEGGAHSLGSAFSSGTGKFNVKSSGSKANSTSSKKKNTSSSKSSGTKSSGSSKSSSNSSSDSTKDKTEEVIDWIEVYLNEMSRATEIAVDNIDRAIGLASKQAKSYEAIGKVQEEITANQRAADKYLAKANSVGLNETYASKVRNGTLDIETITDEDLKKKIDDYKTYYKDYEDSLDKVRDLEDKLSDLAEKRLEIIEKEYDAIVDINDAIKDVADSKMELNDALGTAVDNGDNISNLNKSIKAQEDTYNQLTKKLNEYQAEVNSQLSSGLLKQGSEAYQEAMKNIQDFSAKIYDASKELIELQDKLNQIKIDTIQNVIDAFERRTSKLDKYASLLESQDKEVPESVYQEQIDTNNAQVQKNQEQRNLLLEQQSVYDVNSSRYKELAEDINKLDESTLGLLEDNEKLKDSIYELRISNLEKAIQGYDDLEDELKDFRSLLNDDAFLDKNGAITDEGLAQITLLSQSLGNVKKKISDLTTGLSKLTEMYNNGLISLDEYNDKSSEYRKEIRSATSDVKDYQDSLVSLYTDALKAEVDALDKVIDKRREAYKQQREYADYQKKVNSQQKDVNSIKAQIQAMENSSDAATLARVKKLKQDLADAEDDLNTTKQDHKDDLIDQGFQKMSDDLNQMLEDTEYEISHNADKQNEIIQSMLNKQVGMYQEAYSKINSIIKNTGWVGSNDFNNNQSQMSSQTGAQNQASNASQSQQTANSKPSSSASGTDTSGIKDNASENNKITENIMKPENTTNRPVAELKVSKSSVSIEEGKSTSVTTKIRPNDAANKKLSWKSSNTAIATVSNGTISGKKPGSCQVTVSTTDGSGISKTIAVTVTKKPVPPKPAQNNTNKSGGDGVPRVGDVVTFNGKYYYDSWGKRPAGSLYSGVKNGVVIDNFSSRDYGGSARYTGDLKVHIKSRDGRHGDLGWVRLSQISGYAKGTPGVDRDQIAIVDEEGRELQIPNGKGGRITKLEKGTGVIPHTATEKLMALSEQLDNNGNMVINGRTIEEYVNDMANMQSIAVPDFSDVTASVVSQLEGKGMGNVTVEYNQPVTFNSVDKNDIPQMEEFLKRAREDTTKYIVKELRKGGMQIRR